MDTIDVCGHISVHTVTQHYMIALCTSKTALMWSYCVVGHSLLPLCSTLGSNF